MSELVDIDQYNIKTEPYYESVGNELELYSSAYEVRMPMMIKGPTGCGKSRCAVLPLQGFYSALR